MAAESSEAISDFITQYSQDKYFYDKAASLAKELCQSKLASNAIRAIVSHRAKQVNQLEAKLKDRVLKLGKIYRQASDIRTDIVDLAGVRIGLYFPGDAEMLVDIINTSFDVIKKISWPEHEAGTIGMNWRAAPGEAGAGNVRFGFKQRFGGYLADHYRVRMKLENLATQELRDDFRRLEPIIEIQVASLLMHAWQEVHHDLVYKTLPSGPASQEELRLLDASNGLVHSGEVLLQQLQIAVEQRVSYQEENFADQYELGSFLRARRGLAHAPTDQLDVLFEILVILELDSPRKLGSELDTMPLVKDASIGLAVLDHILVPSPPGTGRTNGMKMSRRHFNLPKIVVPEINYRTGTVDIEEREDNQVSIIDYTILMNVDIQSDTLDAAIQISDLMHYPNKSMLVIEGTQPTASLHQFHEIRRAIVSSRENIKQRLEKDWEISTNHLRAIDQLWAWFEENEDILYRVSLKLASVTERDIVDTLRKIRPETGIQRVSDTGPLRPATND